MPAGRLPVRGLPARTAPRKRRWAGCWPAYAFDRYRAQTPATARLVAPEGSTPPRLEAIAAGEALTRDLINTPAADMGPAELEAACARSGRGIRRAMRGDRGDDLLAEPSR